MTVRNQTKAQRKETLERVLAHFVKWCEIEYQFRLYDYQVRIARACLSSLLVEPKDVCIKIARQSGKTETITLLVRFLLIFHRLLVGGPLMAGFASPKGEQAKTDVDRIKKSVPQLRERWQVEDREFNVHTVRAYRFDSLFAEIFRFSLAPTTSNESKTLNLLIVEEAHKIDDQKRSNELDPMLSSTGGVTWMIGVGAPQMCDFKRGCDGELPDTDRIVIDADAVISDRKKMYEQTGDPIHLEYKRAFERELKKKGRENPEIRMNYYLEDIVETSNFVSRERLLSCGRQKPLCADRFFLGIDWARESDETWLAVATKEMEIVTWFVYPHVNYEDQIAMMMKDLAPYRGKIEDVLSDATGQGDGPTEMLFRTWLPVGDSTKFKFTMQSKNDLYVNFEECLFRDQGTERRFSYPSTHRLAPKFEEQMNQLEREYKGDGEYLSVHHPDQTGARDDAPDATALALYCAAQGGIGEILVA
jgi:hypothetical protein